MNDINKKIILSSIIIVVIIIVILITIILMNINLMNAPIDEQGNYRDAKVEYIAKNEVEPVTNKNKYFAVENILKTYFLYINYLDINMEELEIVLTDDLNEKELIEEYKRVGIKALKEMLDKSYLKEFNITDDKIYTNLKEYSNESIEINEMYMIEKTANINLFYVFATTTNSKEEFNIMVKTDSINETFSIFPSEYMEKHGYNDINNVVEIDTNNLEKSTYNTFRYVNISNEYIVNQYFKKYKEKALSNPTLAYNLLEEEYRNARFGSLEEFTKYIEENKETLVKASVEKYKMDLTNEYKQYVALDQNDNYYIFREKAIMEYRVILDTYTIDLPEFLEKYNKANEQEKVALNINKFIEAINAKDYKYAYSKLSEGFKNNYFKTQESFEKYIKANFYTINQIQFNNFSNQANIYTYTTIITDKATKQQKQKNFVVKLNEGTNFEMSFEI